MKSLGILFVALLIGCVAISAPSGLIGTWRNIRTQQEELVLSANGTGRIRVTPEWRSVKWSFDHATLIVTISDPNEQTRTLARLRFSQNDGILSDVVDSATIPADAPPMATWALYSARSLLFPSEKTANQPSEPTR